VSEIIIPHANEARWSSPYDGTFSDPVYWLQGASPSPTDHVIFSVATDPDAVAPFVVTLDANTTSDRLSARQGHVRLDLGTHSYSLTNAASATPSLSIG